VQVDYTLTNNGSRTMDSATITVRVACNVAGGYGYLAPEQATPGVTLIPGGSITDTLTFTFPDVVSNVVWEVVGAGWNEFASTD
jgi:hypothetical protein